MYIHEEIMEAMALIQKKHQLEKPEVVAEMGQAIHVMMTFNDKDIGKMLKNIQKAGVA